MDAGQGRNTVNSWSRPLGLALIALASGLLPAQAAHNDPKEVAAIHQVVEQFRTSIINKDKPTFVSLFYSDNPQHVVWQFVVDDARLAHVKQTKPDAIKARRIPDNNYLTFIDGITKPGARPVEETFDNVVVDTDGEVASVAFDYAFLAEGKQTNWGREMWHLVRVEAGWKIISVIYTIRDPLPK